MSDSDRLDTLLRLGRQIRKAAQAEEWPRAADLVERRTEAFQKLEDVGEEGADASRMDRRKLQALFAQNESLAELFRGRREELEEELAQIGDLRRAQNSYRENSTQSGALHDDLTG